MPSFSLNSITTHNRIFFRADAHAQIGLGHASRLLALAEILEPHFPCFFITAGLPATMIAQVLKICRQIHTIPENIDLASEPAYLTAHILQAGDLLVLDGYQFTEAYQRTVRPAGIRLVCLDDLSQIHVYADMVINPAGGIQPTDYQGEIYTTYKLGPAFAPIRLPFRQAAGQRKKPINTLEDIFICFGGSDSYNLTIKAIHACLSVRSIHKIHAVVGTAYLHTDMLRQVADASEKVVIYQDLSAAQMVALMQTCQVAITPASTIAYEVCMVGLGLITGMSADNQQGIAQYLSAAGCAVHVGDFHQATEEDIRQCIVSYDLPVLQEQLSCQAKAFFDNASLLLKLFQRLAIESHLSVRKAHWQDLMTYYYWANEPETRRQAIHSDTIPLEAHTLWFKRKIDAATDFLFIFERDQQPVGQVRFDLEKTQYIISFSVDAAFRGQGLGSVLIKMGLEKLQQNLAFRPKVKAYVKPANAASMQVFRQNSFLSTGQEEINHVLLEVFEK